MLNNEIRLPQQIGWLIPRKLLYKLSKSTNISTYIFICTHGGSWVPIIKISNSKIEYFYTIVVNISIVSNVKKLT